MNWNQVEGQWHQIKGRVKERWGDLSHDELDQLEGKREQLLGKIQRKYGISREEAERQIGDWQADL